jgi:2-polyprenyl-6-methoxyphenol hydroxylase-like FAD-dependent oxidoreductase
VRVIVAGAGIGGLAAAAGLLSARIEAAVFEQLDQIGATLVGGGFHLWPNAVRALRELGLDEAARARAAPLEVTEFRSWRGRKLAEWPLTEIGRELDLFDVGIGRTELLDVLRGAVDESHVTAGAKLIDFDQDAEGVTARFDDGREERGELLVGADGLRSIVRTKLLGAGEPDYAGYVQWQTLVDVEPDLFPSGVERITFGPGARTVMHHVSGGRLFWACILYRPVETAGAAPGRKQMLLDSFQDWPEPIAAAIEATPEEQIVGLPVYDRPPVQSWGLGRVTLLGDAAHPMTTNTSQGGNLAIEDGVVLARTLAGSEPSEAALRAYEQRRIARTTPLVKNSRWISNMNAWRNPVRVAFRDRLFSVGVPRKGLSDLRKTMAEPL